MTSSDPQTNSFPFALGCLLLLMLGLTGPARAQVQDISYTLTPAGERVFWAEDVGLSYGYLYGGQAGLGFGHYLELSGLYLLGNDFETDFSGFSADDEAVLAALQALPPREVDVRQYGGVLRFNLGRGSLYPFLSFGTGVLTFDPEDLDRSEYIYLSGGAGLVFNTAGRYTISLAIQDLAFRYNPGSALLSEDDLAQTGLQRRDFNQQTVHNPVLRAALQLYLGGRTPGQLTDVDLALREGFRGGRFNGFVEPFYGQIEFNEALNFPDKQPLAGITAGTDLGRFARLRGFYWRGTEEEEAFEDGLPDGFRDLQLYGGEMDLRFSSAYRQRVTPYLTIGGGYVDVGNDYRGRAGFNPESRFFASGGGGLEVPLARFVRLNVGVRSLFMSTQDAEDVSDPSSVYGSLMYTAGLSFGFGQPRRRTPGELLDARVEGVRAEALTREEQLEQQIQNLETRLAALTTDLVLAQQGDTLAAARLQERQLQAALEEPAVTVEVEEGAETTIEIEGEPAAPRSNLSDRNVTIPIPETGEIYLRFGPLGDGDAEAVYVPPAVPGAALTAQPEAQTAAPALTAEQIQQIVRQTLSEQLGALDTGTLSDAELARVADRLDDVEDRLERRLDRLQNLLTATGGQQTPIVIDRGRERVIVQQDGTTRFVREAPPQGFVSRTVYRLFGVRQFVGLRPYFGFRLGEGPEKLLVGLRGDYRYTRTDRLWIMPEAALGLVGPGTTSFSIIGNGAVSLRNRFFYPLQPYAGLGLGIWSSEGLSGLDIGLNVLVGSEFTTRFGSVFTELSMLGPADFLRTLFGYRIRF